MSSGPGILGLNLFSDDCGGTAASLATLTFKHDMEGLLPLLECLVGSPPEHLLPSSPHHRMQCDEGKAESMTQQKKSLRSVNVAAEETPVTQEGITHAPLSLEDTHTHTIKIQN